jgi:hypothetical protein
MAEKFHARVYGIFPRRRGFWRVEVGVPRIAHDGASESVTLGLNRWLEDLLRADDNLCASWLWAHDRWRNQDMPSRRLRLEAKRNLLAADLAARGLSAPPGAPACGFASPTGWATSSWRSPPARDPPGLGPTPSSPWSAAPPFSRSSRRGASPIAPFRCRRGAWATGGISVPSGTSIPTAGCCSRIPSAATSRPG